MADTYNQTTIVETASSGVAWSAIFGGAIAAVAVTMLLFPLGSALGLSGAHWNPPGTTDGMAKSLTAASVIWLIIVQWISSGFGGYLTGRLRTKWHGAHTHEVFFRDTAHGFLSWGVATILLTALIVSVAAPMMDGAMHRDMMGRGPGMHRDMNRGGEDVDGLLRPSAPAGRMSPDDARMQADRILHRSGDDINDADRAYLGQLIASQSGVSQDEAQKRVDTMIAQRKSDAEQARKAAAKASLFLFFSMLIGAFIATAAGALGGRHRDLHYGTGSLAE